MGTGLYFARISGVISTDVVATVASVGPYAFHNSVLGKRLSRSTQISGASASPASQKRRSVGIMLSPKDGSIKHRRAKDGVETHIVAFEFFNVWKSSLRLVISSFVT